MTLAGDPRVLLLDEPLAGMGNEESDKISHLLKDLARDHAVLLIEHDMDFVFAVADRMTVMVEGSLLASGPPDAIRADPAVQRAYLGAIGMILAATDLQVFYGPSHILRGVSLNIRPARRSPSWAATAWARAR